MTDHEDELVATARLRDGKVEWQMTDRPEVVEDIRKRAEAATPGPWECRTYGHVESDAGSISLVGNGPRQTENGDFIAHAREDIPYLLAQLDAAREERDDWRRQWENDVTRISAEREAAREDLELAAAVRRLPEDEFWRLSQANGGGHYLVRIGMAPPEEAPIGEGPTLTAAITAALDYPRPDEDGAL